MVDRLDAGDLSVVERLLEGLLATTRSAEDAAAIAAGWAAYREGRGHLLRQPA